MFSIMLALRLNSRWSSVNFFAVNAAGGGLPVWCMRMCVENVFSVMPSLRLGLLAIGVTMSWVCLPSVTGCLVAVWCVFVDVFCNTVTEAETLPMRVCTCVFYCHP